MGFKRLLTRTSYLGFRASLTRTFIMGFMDYLTRMFTVGFKRLWQRTNKLSIFLYFCWLKRKQVFAFVLSHILHGIIPQLFIFTWSPFMCPHLQYFVITICVGYRYIKLYLFEAKIRGVYLVMPKKAAPCVNAITTAQPPNIQPNAIINFQSINSSPL